MPVYTRRSYQKELLDRDDIPFADIQKNMNELNIVNAYLGGHKITCNGIKKILDKQNTEPADKTWIICEIGCGGGDNLLAINKWCKKNNIKVFFIGIDINPHCIESARSIPLDNLELIASDYRNVILNTKPDIIFSSLFCHHFTDEELESQLQWLKKNSSRGFFINDLHRHPLAYHSIKILTRLFSRSYLVKNDAPVSVLRGFKKSEWISLLKKADISDFNIEWKWAFRWLVVVNSQ